MSEEAAIESPSAERHEVVFLRKRFADAIEEVSEARGDLRVTVRRDRIADVLRALRDEAEPRYNFFSECMGVDYLDPQTGQPILGKPHRFEVVYNLVAMDLAGGPCKRLFIKTGVPDQQPSVPTATGVYAGAEFCEREIFDMFGIRFEGHPDLRRILMSDDWVGHPQRKDYPLGGERVEFPGGKLGPAVGERLVAHAGESFTGKTGSDIGDL